MKKKEERERDGEVKKRTYWGGKKKENDFPFGLFF
jgi:hypothetical protein